MGSQSIIERLRRAFAPHWLFAEPLGYQVYRQPLLWMAIAVIAGTRVVHFWAAQEAIWLGALIALLVASHVSQRCGKQTLAGVLALLSAAFFGSLYATINTPPLRDSLSATATRKSEPIAVRCLIQSAAIWMPNSNDWSRGPKSEAWRTRWDVRCESVRDDDKWKPIVALASLTVDGRIHDLLPGDLVEVMGSFQRISQPTNPGGFDYAEHSRQDSKFVSLAAESRSQITILKRTGTHSLRRFRAWLVMQIDRSLHRRVSLGQAPLAAALVFGQREQVDWEDQQELMATGTLHLLAISGMHVEIVAGVILLFAAPFSLRQRTLLIAVVAICGFYAALAGGKPPVLRAVLVVSAFALARTLGRQARLTNVLGLAALVLLLVRVANVDNVGVHLSFLAVGTIGIFVIEHDRRTEREAALRSVIEESFSASKRRVLFCLRSVKSMWMLSVWVWLLTCPLIWLNFHIIAPIAIPLNVLIAFPLMISLVAGLATGLLGWFSPIGWLTGTICGVGLAVIGAMVDACKSIPMGHWWLPAPPTWWIACFYAMAAIWLAAFGRKQNRFLLAILFGWVVLGVALHAFGPRGRWGTNRSGGQVESAHAAEDNEREPRAPVELRCTFLDVGHGTSVIIEMPTGEVWLYDAGHLGSADRSHQDIAAALWQLPTARIDTLLISHADSDHYNATGGLVERFRVGRIASTRQFWSSLDPDVIELLASLKNSVKRADFNAGAEGREGDVQWRVLHPRANWSGESDNASSMCLLLEYAGKRILLPGDLEGSGLLDLVELPNRPCHILMAPHHGSVTLDPSDLLAWCRPQWVVISGNHRAARAEVLEKYRTPDSQVGITFRDGAIQIRIDQTGGLSAWHWSGETWQALR